MLKKQQNNVKDIILCDLLKDIEHGINRKLKSEALIENSISYIQNKEKISISKDELNSKNITNKKINKNSKNTNELKQKIKIIASQHDTKPNQYHSIT